MKRNRIYLILIVFALIFANACGLVGGRKPASHYVTKADAETVLGVPLKVDADVFTESDTRCMYRSADENGFAEMTVIIQTFSSQKELNSIEETSRRVMADGGKSDKIENVGDAAWTATSRKGRSRVIFVRRGYTVLQLIADGRDVNEATLARMKTLAASVAEKL